MITYTFNCVKETQQFYRFEEIGRDGGTVTRESAECNFGTLYLKKKGFTSKPEVIQVTIEAAYANEKD